MQPDIQLSSYYDHYFSTFLFFLESRQRSKSVDFGPDGKAAGSAASNTNARVPNRPPLTEEGKIWPANIMVSSKTYYCTKFTKEVLRTRIIQMCLTADDGDLIDLWVLTRIDHWDNDIECTLCLTEKSILFVSFNFINEKATCTRIPLDTIQKIRIGNLVAPDWSVMPQRDYGVLQLIWGDIGQIKWTNRWNPLSNEIPTAVFHHHPCYYAIEPITNRDMYDCDLAIAAIKVALSKLGIPPEFEDIRLNSRFNVLNVIYNQSNLGFCKDRNGVSF